CGRSVAATPNAATAIRIAPSTALPDSFDLVLDIEGREGHARAGPKGPIDGYTALYRVAVEIAVCPRSELRLELRALGVEGEAVEVRLLEAELERAPGRVRPGARRVGDPDTARNVGRCEWSGLGQRERRAGRFEPRRRARHELGDAARRLADVRSVHISGEGRYNDGEHTAAERNQCGGLYGTQ